MFSYWDRGQVHTLRQMVPHVWWVVLPITNQGWTFLHYLCKKSQNQPVSEQKNLIPMRTCLIIYGIWKAPDMAELIHEDSELACTICAKKKHFPVDFWWIVMLHMNGILIGLIACLSKTFPMNEFKKPSLLNPHIQLISGHITHWPYWNHLSKYSHLSLISIWWFLTWLIKLWLNM